jgi:tight adherence protein B
MTALSLIVFVGVAASLVLLAFALGLGGTRPQLKKRAAGLRDRASGKGPRITAQAAALSLRRTEGRSLPLLEAMAERLLPRQAELRDRLTRTGFQITIGTYAAVCATTALVAMLGFAAGAGLALPAAALGGIAIGIALPHMVIGMLGARRTHKFMAHLPDAIDLMVRGLKAGLPVTESMAMAGKEMPAPLGTEFRGVTDSVRLGRGLEDALWETARRLRTPEFNFLVISMSIQRETGGNLAETLANLSDILRKRRQLRLKIKALSSEARASAYLLGALPFGLMALINAINPEYMAVLFSDPRGNAMLAAGGALLVVGFAIMAKMIRFEI